MVPGLAIHPRRCECGHGTAWHRRGGKAYWRRRSRRGREAARRPIARELKALIRPGQSSANFRPSQLRLGEMPATFGVLQTTGNVEDFWDSLQFLQVLITITATSQAECRGFDSLRPLQQLA
jgi:hypothetical protein